MADPTEADINSVCEMLEAYDTKDRQMFSRALKVRPNTSTHAMFLTSRQLTDTFSTRPTTTAYPRWSTSILRAKIRYICPWDEATGE